MSTARRGAAWHGLARQGQAGPARLVTQARDAGCDVHLKPNLVNGRPGMTLPNEYPTRPTKAA